MGDTFSQIYIQIVFAVRNRKKMIHSSWEEQLFKFIAGIIKNNEQKLLAINGNIDFLDEYVAFLKEYEIDFEMKYL